MATSERWYQRKGLSWWERLKRWIEFWLYEKD
jgi:hypothetical protein